MRETSPGRGRALVHPEVRGRPSCAHTERRHGPSHEYWWIRTTMYPRPNQAAERMCKWQWWQHGGKECAYRHAIDRASSHTSTPIPLHPLRGPP